MSPPLGAYFQGEPMRLRSPPPRASPQCWHRLGSQDKSRRSRHHEHRLSRPVDRRSRQAHPPKVTSSKLPGAPVLLSGRRTRSTSSYTSTIAGAFVQMNPWENGFASSLRTRTTRSSATVTRMPQHGSHTRHYVVRSSALPTSLVLMRWRSCLGGPDTRRISLRSHRGRALPSAYSTDQSVGGQGK